MLNKNNYNRHTKKIARYIKKLSTKKILSEYQKQFERLNFATNTINGKKLQAV